MENTQPQAGTPIPTGQEPVAPTADPNTAPTADTIDSLPSWAQTMIRSLRGEAANHRVKLNEFEKAAEERRQAELSDLERAQEAAKVAAAERDALNERLQRSEILFRAQAKGIVDPDAAYALLDKSALNFDAPESLDAALDALVQAKPYLAGHNVRPQPITAPATTSPTNGGRAESHLPVYTREQMADRRFYEANRDAINAAIREGRIQ